jgi:hypothetical protein
MRYAHRVAYALAGNEIPPGAQIDHMCHNKGCVNPGHLRATSPKENNENRGGPQYNTVTGVRGVFYVSGSKKYRVQIGHLGKSHYVGVFDTLHEAEAAAIAKRNELFTHNDLDRKTA